MNNFDSIMGNGANTYFYNIFKYLIFQKVNKYDKEIPHSQNTHRTFTVTRHPKYERGQRSEIDTIKHHT